MVAAPAVAFWLNDATVRQSGRRAPSLQGAEFLPETAGSRARPASLGQRRAREREGSGALIPFGLA